MDLGRVRLAAIALAITGCAERRPAVIVSRLVPSVVLGTFDNHDMSSRSEPIHDLLYEAPLPPLAPKTEPALPRESVAAPSPVVRRATLPDDVVLRLLEGGRAVFVRCFKQASTRDALVTSFKVRVHVELDGDGSITSVSADTTDPDLAGCLTRGTRYLRFPATEQPVAVELPLFYRAE